MERKRISRWMVVGFLLVGWYFPALAEEVQQEVNLVINGSFEKGSSADGSFKEKTFYWSKDNGVRQSGICNVDNTTSTDGEKSLRIDSTIEAQFGHNRAVYQILNSNFRGKLKPSTEYILKADIKRTTTKLFKKDYVSVNLLEKAEMGGKWKCHECGNKSTKTNVWEHFEIRFKTKSKICRATIYIYNKRSQGIAWFDNIVLEEISEVL